MILLSVEENLVIFVLLIMGESLIIQTNNRSIINIPPPSFSFFILSFTIPDNYIF